MKADDLFARITDAIAAQLERGVRPWSKPWTSQPGVLTMPHNIEGRAYSGGNVFWLWLQQEVMGYPTACWMTFNQAKARGGTVPKGGTPVYFYGASKKVNEATGKEESRPFAKVFYVWNIAQVEGLTVAPPATVEPAPEFERIAAADALMAATGAVIRHGGAKAFYSPDYDSIQLPERADFVSADGYYSTAFHELGHWTGAEKRLNRTFGKKFGDDAYAFEELVAELTSALICGSQGFASLDREDHASYLANFLRILKADPKAFSKAASEAQKAAKLILESQGAANASEPQALAA